MKVCIQLFASILLTMNAYANCSDAYKNASKRRDIRNEVITVAAGVTAMAVAPTLFPTATIYFVGKYTLTVLTAVSITELKREGIKIYKNNFDKLLFAFEAAENNDKNKHLNHLIRSSIKKAQVEDSVENQERVRALLAQGFDDGTFCPVVGVDRRGLEKQVVFSRKAILNYVALNLNN